MLRQGYAECGGDDEDDNIDWCHIRNGREVNRAAVLSQWRDLPLCKLVAVTWGGIVWRLLMEWRQIGSESELTHGRCDTQRRLNDGS